MDASVGVSERPFPSSLIRTSVEASKQQRAPHRDSVSSVHSSPYPHTVINTNTNTSASTLSLAETLRNSNSQAQAPLPLRGQGAQSALGGVSQAQTNVHQMGHEALALAESSVGVVVGVALSSSSVGESMDAFMLCAGANDSLAVPLWFFLHSLGVHKIAARIAAPFLLVCHLHFYSYHSPPLSFHVWF